jgi:hypothetical protein
MRLPNLIANSAASESGPNFAACAKAWVSSRACHPDGAGWRLIFFELAR